MVLSFKRLEEEIDFLLESMHFSKHEPKLGIEAKDPITDISDGSKSYTFVYNFCISENKNPDLTFSEKIHLGKYETKEEIVKNKYEEIGNIVKKKKVKMIFGDTVRLRYTYNQDSLFKPKNLITNLPERFCFYSVEDIAQILSVKKISVVNYVTKGAGEDTDLGSYTFSRDHVVKLFSELEEEDIRSPPLVYAAMNIFRKNLENN
ncbi:MAG: hypothetical protein KAU20_06115 [Nanoarchaeota archaeon]|nr:hypothetical protein [Nanoarchaeota archaeon]